MNGEASMVELPVEIIVKYNKNNNFDRLPTPLLLTKSLIFIESQILFILSAKATEERREPYSFS